MSSLRTLKAIERIGRPDLSKTKATKESNRDIARFENQLAGFVLYIQGQQAITTDDKKRLFVLFYRFTEKEYFIGQQYSDRTSQNYKPVTRRDVEKIDTLAKQNMKTFLSGLQQEGLVIFESGFDVDGYDIDRLLKRFDDFEEVILEKARDKTKSNNNNNGALTALAFPDFLSRISGGIRSGIDRIASGLGIRSLNDGTLSNAELVEFVTEGDDKVCPICDGYDGEVFEVDPDTGIIEDGPVIPDETHPNCRCRYLLIEDEGDDGE